MASRSAILWGAAALICGLGGYATTVLEVRTVGVQEGSPLVRRLSGNDPGLGPFAVLKFVSVTLFFTVYWALKPTVAQLTVPLSLTVLGAVVTARNAWIIYRHA